MKQLCPATLRFRIGCACVGLLALLSACRREAPRPPDQTISRSPLPAAVIETQLTRVAAKRVEAQVIVDKLKIALPELRIYDRQHRLIFHETGFEPGTVSRTIQTASSADRPIDGPSFADTVADLETADHKPLTALLRSKGRLTVFDYWAVWCIPCKALDKELRSWARQQRPGSVEIIRVDSDWTKLASTGGEKVFLVTKGPDGKLSKVEVK